MVGLLHFVQRGAWGAWLPPRQSPLIAVPNVTAHPSTASVPTSYHSIWQYYLYTLRVKQKISKTATLATKVKRKARRLIVLNKGHRQGGGCDSSGRRLTIDWRSLIDDDVEVRAVGRRCIFQWRRCAKRLLAAKWLLAVCLHLFAMLLSVFSASPTPSFFSALSSFFLCCSCSCFVTHTICLPQQPSVPDSSHLSTNDVIVAMATWPSSIVSWFLSAVDRSGDTLDCLQWDGVLFTCSSIVATSMTLFFISSEVETISTQSCCCDSQWNSSEHDDDDDDGAASVVAGETSA